MPKVLISADSITICGANAWFMFGLTLVTVPLSVLGGLLVFLLAFYEPLGWSTPIYWVAFASFIALIILMPKLCWQDFNACTTFDRVSQLVTVQKSGGKKVHNVGKFKKILLQPIQTMRSGRQYHAYLVGENGQCHLEIVAVSKRGLSDKLKAVAEFLAIPMEEATDIAGLEVVFDSKRRMG